MVRDHQISIFAWLHVQFLDWVFNSHSQRLFTIIHDNAILFFRNFSRLENRYIRPCPSCGEQLTRLHYPRKIPALNYRRAQNQNVDARHHCGHGLSVLPQQLSVPNQSGGLRRLLAGHCSSYDSERKRALNSGRTCKNLTCPFQSEGKHHPNILQPASQD